MALPTRPSHRKAHENNVRLTTCFGMAGECSSVLETWINLILLTMFGNGLNQWENTDLMEVTRMDCGVALQYTQFVTVCSKHGHVDKVLEVWNEWCQSTIGRRDNTLHSEIFRGAVMTVLSTHPTTVSEAVRCWKSNFWLNVILMEMFKHLGQCWNVLEIWIDLILLNVFGNGHNQFENTDLLEVVERIVMLLWVTLNLWLFVVKMVMLTKCWECGMNGVNQQLEEETTHFTVKYFVELSSLHLQWMEEQMTQKKCSTLIHWLIKQMKSCFCHCSLHFHMQNFTKEQFQFSIMLKKKKLCRLELTMQSLMLVHVLVSLILLLKLLIKWKIEVSFQIKSLGWHFYQCFCGWICVSRKTNDNLWGFTRNEELWEELANSNQLCIFFGTLAFVNVMKETRCSKFHCSFINKSTNPKTQGKQN